MWNAIQSPSGPGTPEMPISRFPTAQSPMPAFFFVGRPESPQPMSPAPEFPRQRSPWPQTPLPTLSLPERPDTLEIFSRHPNFEQENPFGLRQSSRFHGILDHSNSRTSESFDDPPNQGFQAELLAQLRRRLVIQSPTTNQPETSSTDANDTWNNLNHQPPVDFQSATTYPDSSATPVYLSPLQLPLDIPFSHLRVNFGGNSKPLGWNTVRPSVETFLEQTRSPLRLTVIWSPSSSEDDPGGWRGGKTFKLLFNRLSMPMIEPGWTPLTGVERISINVSETFEEVDIFPVTGLQRTREEQAVINANRIDLCSASNVKELFLQGSHLFFAEKLSNLPGGQLILLCVTCCKISVNDTLVLLQACSRLQDATFGTVHGENDCELGDRFKLKPGAEFTSKLEKFTITSFVDVSPIVRSLNWETGPAITITILDDVVAGQDWEPCFARIPMSTQLTINGNFPPEIRARIRDNIRGVVFAR